MLNLGGVCMQASKKELQLQVATTRLASHRAPVPTRQAVMAAAVAAGRLPQQQPSRPQELFVPAVDNSNTPFVPQLEHLEGIMDEVVAAGGTSRGHAPLNKQQVANLNANEFASGRKATYGPTHLA
jgi:hypothetical protein